VAPGMPRGRLSCSVQTTAPLSIRERVRLSFRMIHLPLMPQQVFYGETMKEVLTKHSRVCW
jgi:hypothetical protein